MSGMRTEPASGLSFICGRPSLPSSLLLFVWFGLSIQREPNFRNGWEGGRNLSWTGAMSHFWAVALNNRDTLPHTGALSGGGGGGYATRILNGAVFIPKMSRQLEKSAAKMRWSLFMHFKVQWNMNERCNGAAIFANFSETTSLVR